VFCYDMPTGKFTAHVNQSLLGKDVKALKEKDGSPLGEKVFKRPNRARSRRCSYNFAKPGTTEPVARESTSRNQGCGVGSKQDPCGRTPDNPRRAHAL
jgi:hypothetical protein